MATIARKLITAEEFARMPDPADGARQELVRGEIVTMTPPTFRHGLYQVRICGLLDQYVRGRRLGRVTVETGVVTERDPDTVRGPDVSYWSAETLPFDQIPEGYPDVPADLCVEVVTEHTKTRTIRQKISEYFRRGVKMVWIVDMDQRTATVYRTPDQGRILHEAATLSGEDVIPGFSCTVAELFD